MEGTTGKKKKTKILSKLRGKNTWLYIRDYKKRRMRDGIKKQHN